MLSNVQATFQQSGPGDSYEQIRELGTRGPRVMANWIGKEGTRDIVTVQEGGTLLLLDQLRHFRECRLTGDF